MTDSLINIAPSVETGKLQVFHLKRYWEKALLKRYGKLPAGAFHEEWKTDTTLLAALGLGLEQTLQYLYQTAPTFEQFESWIIEVTGGPDQEKLNKFNRIFTDQAITVSKEEDNQQLLTPADLDFWNENGYLIIRDAAKKETCDEAIAALCDFINVDRYDAGTWYNEHPARKGIMVQLFQHPALEENRKASKIRKVFEELWQRADLFVNTDRVGFNPPETSRYQFQGPRLHWDTSLHLPMPFGLQGILYLADTAENQGAFTLVPGFHKKIEEWLRGLPQGVNPRQQDLYALGPKPITANAGDFIVWDNRLPHGSSPNTSAIPRFVQYINYAPADKEESEIWI